MNITNEEFLKCLFGSNYHYAHVTDFIYDPDNIPDGQALYAWMGDYFKNYVFTPLSNQYFTISIFAPDEHGKARRRKALYNSTPVIVLDDVKEKLTLAEVQKLPSPSWILETSPGSEQWGYILTKPCTERQKVENLLDGLVANGLAPDGKDPGMKGVTRYVRLPGGVNNKARKLVNGQPFRCNLIDWQPFKRVTIESLAEPFKIDLLAERRDTRIDGAALVPDNPLLHIPDIIHVKEIRSDGRYDITCPWVDEHTGGVDNGSAIFTNADGTIGFKCHHGACEGRHAGDLLDYVECYHHGFKSSFNIWNMQHMLAQQPINNKTLPMVTPPPSASNSQEVIVPKLPTLADLFTKLRSEPFNSPEAMEMASQFLKVVDDLAEIERVNWHKQVKDVMRWTNPEFKSIISDLRNSWYSAKKDVLNFYSETVFVGELNQFYDCDKRIFYTPDGFQNMHSHLDAEARKESLQGGKGTKVHKIDYYPNQPQVFEENGIKYANTWSNKTERTGAKGDISPWLDHFDILGWTEHKDHIIDWIAFTIQHPDIKINHALLFGSREGGGKDFILEPLIQALGQNSKTIDGHELISNFNGYLMGIKHLHINEAEIGGRAEARAVSGKLKPLCAAPPDTIRVRELYVKPMNIRNLTSVTITTNSQIPIELENHSRRIFALWSDFTPRDENEVTIPVWQAYWVANWEWMRKLGGCDAVIHYLRYERDVSQFNPGIAPPVTEFLTNIRENSKHPIQQTLEFFIKSEKGIFSCDILSSNEIARAIRTEVTLAEDILTETKFFTPSRVNAYMMHIPYCKQSKIATMGGTRNVWILRNHEKYANMFARELGVEYEEQFNNWRNKHPLSVVKNY